MKKANQRIAQYKKQVQDVAEKKGYYEPGMPVGTKKQEARIRRLEAEIRRLKKTSDAAIATRDTLQVELRLVEHARDTAKDRQFSLSAEKDREQLAAKLKTPNREQQLLGVTQELTAAHEIIEPSQYPLEGFALIRCRFFYQSRNRSGWFSANEEENRAAHDGNLGADVSLLRLDKFTSVDAEFVKSLYPVGAVDAVISSSEVNRLRLRVSAQELVDLRASISLKNTAILSLLKALQRLDDKCMKKWLDLGGEGVDDELQCWCFNDDGEVLGWIRQMRKIRKRAAGRTGKRVSYEDESPAMTSSGDVDGE
ncbi:uncharacterized protein RSE6_11607 [Rhynchosporium secalis]|uniref:Uncharacterized protein n=1 Tax=Rhynchosporium secalis TaxID=38038 RepID=A0A1E1MND0_RHYSE|nr:uncharacterized protein RSE6_11607 [Rhynchosporium secalis]